MARTLILPPARTHRILARLAYQVLERNRSAEAVELFGIVHRGVALAEAMAAIIAEAEGLTVPVHALDVTPFRDDRTEEPSAPDASISVEDRSAVLVDDVLFTGRTARAAIDAVLQYGRPRSIQLAVLVDRGHREYPIQPDFVGQTIPTKHRERVTVEVDGETAVYLEE